MLISVMKVIVYTHQGARWHKEFTERPDWEAIAAAIRRLDKFAYPIVDLYFKDDDVYEAPRFEIMGGTGDWTMSADFYAKTFYNPLGNPDKSVHVWQSDQGAEPADTSVCHDIEVVLKATKYYCEYGMLDPSLSWTDV